jgi:iron complex outermembrane recepter protein
VRARGGNLELCEVEGMVDAPLAGNTVLLRAAFKSEHTHDVEAGLKYAGTAFDRPARLNVNIYNQWITDVQRVEFPIGPGGTSLAVTANVPSALARGIEAEGAFLPAARLQIGGSVSYTTPFSYGPFADTPKLSGVLFAEDGLPTGGDIGSIKLRAEAYSQSEQYFSSAADSIAPGTRLPGYTLGHARINSDDIMRTRLSAALFGKNVTNKAYFVGGMQLAAALGHNAAAVGEPRTYGLELSYRF